MPTISTNEFIAMLSTGGVKILTIKARIIPDMRKTGNPYIGRVTKIVTANGVIGADYEKSVNRRLEKAGEEANFESGPRQWGEKLNNTFTTNKDGSKQYINFQENSRKDVWYLDGQEVDKSMFYPWTSKPQKEKGVDPLADAKDEVQYRNFTISNIISVKYQGEEWHIGENVGLAQKLA